MREITWKLEFKFGKSLKNFHGKSRFHINSNVMVFNLFQRVSFRQLHGFPSFTSNWISNFEAVKISLIFQFSAHETFPIHLCSKLPNAFGNLEENIFNLTMTYRHRFYIVRTCGRTNRFSCLGLYLHLMSVLSEGKMSSTRLGAVSFHLYKIHLCKTKLESD